MAGQGVGFSELSSSSNGSDNTKRPGTPQITPSELSRPVNLQRIAQRKAQIKTYPVRKKLEKLSVYSSCKVKVTWPHFIVYAHWSGMMEKSFIMPLFSLFPVGSHSPSMVFFSFSLSIKWNVKVRRHHKTCKVFRMTVNVWFQKISIPPPRKTLWFASPPPTPQDFPFHGAFDDPPLLKNFHPLTTLFDDPPLLRNFPPFLLPSEIQSGFST